MKVISVHAAQPKQVEWKGQIVTTSIFKEPVEGKQSVNNMGLEVDTQSDLTVHGGIYKAVYAYPSEHYDYWKKEMPDFEFNWGAFGENLTTTGIIEEEVSIGDRYRIGSVEFKVAQPRFPCMKLGVRFNDPQMTKRFLQSRRSGLYFQVLQDGALQKGDEIELLEKTQGVSIRTFVELYAEKNPDPALIQAVLDDPNLIEDWKEYFENKLLQVS